MPMTVTKRAIQIVRKKTPQKLAPFFLEACAGNSLSVLTVSSWDMAVSDSVIRLLDGAIASESLVDESFNQPLLEYPQYTEPADYEGDKVPDILYTGDHKAIDKWRRKQSLALTRKYRPDLFKKLELTKQDRKLLEELDEGETPKWETDALEKGKKFIKK